jgi:hypothetical protein
MLVALFSCRVCFAEAVEDFATVVATAFVALLDLAVTAVTPAIPALVL